MVPRARAVVCNNSKCNLAASHTRTLLCAPTHARTHTQCEVVQEMEGEREGWRELTSERQAQAGRL